MDYALTVWGNTSKGNVKALQSIQNRCARILCNNYDLNVRSRDLLHQLKILDVNQRIKYLQGVLMFKCMHNVAPYYMCDMFTQMSSIHSHHTRNNLLQIPMCHTSHMKRSFAHSGATLWNSLPANFKCASSLYMFKDLLRCHAAHHF